MALRCLLFTSDQGTAEPICQVLAGLGVEGDYCADAAAAIEKVTSQPFQIVIIDWDAQPEAGSLLTAARERKAAERPLTLAIVSDDVSVPQALQAGANSILRKPIMVNQVNDTLTTARDLLRAKQESASAAQAAAAGMSASGPPSATTIPASVDQDSEKKTLRAGEFLQTSGTAPGAQFDTESDMHQALEHSAEPVDPLKDLEPMAASVVASVKEQKPVPVAPPPPAPGETRGLQWYLNARASTLPPVPAPSAAAAAPAPAPAKPELLGFDQTPTYLEERSDLHSDSHSGSHSGSRFGSHSEEQPSESSEDTAWAPIPAASALPAPRHDAEHEQKAEAKLFAYISGEEEEAEEKPRRSFRLPRGPIAVALILAACGIVAAPQAPWHPQVRALWGHGQQMLHAWLNPQPAVTPPAPESHESFGRAGDEYKLPVAENIPDATTDPSQIHVVPVVDPTAKKPSANGDQATQEPTNTNPTDAPPPAGTQPAVTQGTDPAQGNPVPPNQTQPNQAQPNQVSPNQASPNQAQPNPAQGNPTVAPDAAQPASQPSVGGTIGSPGATAVAPAVVQPRPDPTTVVAPAPAPVATQPAQPKNPQPHYASTPANVPSSLKSQMASMTPDASGNKAPEAAMQSIEPVVVPEATERALLTDQPAIDYPATAKGQQGTVVLQILVGRDGTVQDAKFMQGSLAFARTAIDGVKLWKFKPYSMNGRAVSVQSTMTMSFKPGS